MKWIVLVALVITLVFTVFSVSTQDLSTDLCQWFPSLCPVAGGGGSGAGN